MTEWTESTLGELAKISIGRTPPTKDPAYWTDDLARPFCTIADMAAPLVDPRRQGVTELAEKEGKAKRVPKGALLMSFKLSIGRVGFAARDLFPNEAIAWLEPTLPDLDVRFLAHALEAQDLTENSGRAVKGATLNGHSLRAIRIAYPSRAEQRRIVAVMAAVDALTEALGAEVAAIDAAYTNGLGLLWLEEDGAEANLQALREHLDLNVQRVKVDSDRTYRIAGVLNAGQGVIARETINGRETDYATLNRLSAGQVVMRKLTAWEGTLAVVPANFDGYFASNEFPTFSFRPTMIPGYFAHVCRSTRLWSEMQNRVTGTVQRRKRLNPDQLLDVALPIPALVDQARVATVLDEMVALKAAAEAELAAVRIVRADLLGALLSREIAVDAAVDMFVNAA